MKNNYLFWVGLFIFGFLLGLFLQFKSCNNSPQQPLVVKDTIYQIQFRDRNPDSVILYKDKIVYKDRVIKGNPNTVIKEVPRIEKIIETKYVNILQKDTSCIDSLKTYKDMIAELENAIDSLNRYKVFEDSVKTKNYLLNYVIFGKDVTNVASIVKLRNRLSFYPTLGLGYQTNGKDWKNFTYYPAIGATLTYSKLLINGSVLWSTKSNNLNNYNINIGYKF